MREARAVNRINHPNIVEITDFGEDGGLVFLVMEYVEGESLQAALGRGRFETLQAARIADLRIAAARSPTPTSSASFTAISSPRMCSW